MYLHNNYKMKNYIIILYKFCFEMKKYYIMNSKKVDNVQDYKLTK